MVSQILGGVTEHCDVVARTCTYSEAQVLNVSVEISYPDSGFTEFLYKICGSTLE
jgi:hypothetical protein